MQIGSHVKLSDGQWLEVYGEVYDGAVQSVDFAILNGMPVDVDESDLMPFQRYVTLREAAEAALLDTYNSIRADYANGDA